MRRATVVGLGVAAVGLLTAGGCGLPDDRNPRVVTAQEAPLDLAEAADGNAAALGNIEVTVYFVREQSLVAVERRVAAGDLETVINSLLDRPTTEEESEGLRTEIPAETVLRDATATAGLATIDLGCAPGDDPTVTLPSNCGVRGAEGTAQLILFAQLVCTANSVAGVERVLFLQDGASQPAPIDGGISTEPVRCADYRSVRQPG